MKTAMTILMLLLIPTALFANGVETKFLSDGGEYIADRFLITTVPGVQPLDTEGVIDGIAFSGVTSIDNLCQSYGVVDIEPFYTGPVHTPALSALIPRVYILHVNSDVDVLNAVNAFSGISDIEVSEPYILPIPDYIPDDPSRTAQYFLNNISAYDAWDVIHGDTTRHAIVSIVDSGVYWMHPDLAPNMWINVPEDLNGNGTMDAGDYNGIDDDGNGFVDDVIGWDNGMNDNDPREETPFHGTHVAGCASEATDNGIGGAGIGFSARVMANKGSNGANQLTQVYQAMIWATQNGTHIINCSWSSTYYSSTYQSMCTGMWNDGVVIVASAGNHGTQAMHYPAAYNNVIGVVATNQSDHKAGFSGYGSWCGISAPGVSIYSTWSTGTYINSDGTSMASPITAGVFGLLKAANPTWTNEELVETVLSTADDIDDINPSYAGLLGSGRVNAYAALAAATLPNFIQTDTQITITDDDGDGVLNPGESFDLVLTFENTWAAATNVTATITGDEYFTMVDSVADFGDIGHNQSSDNSSNPFQISTVAGMPPAASTLNLHLTADGYETDLELNLATSLYMANFPVSVSGMVESSPLIMDINHDGAKELIIGASDNKVHVFNTLGEYRTGWPKDVSQNVVTGPAVGSLTDDGTFQIVATTKDGKVYAWNDDGSDVTGFPVTIGGTMYSGAMLIDLDNNQDLEIVVGSFANNSIHVFEHDGSYFPGWPLDTANKWYGSPASGDIDDDGLMEIIYAGFDSLVHAYNADGSEVSGFPVNIGNVVWASVAVGDVDGDNDPEIAVVNSSGSLYLINHDGSIANGYPVSSSSLVRSAPSLADVDGNGSLEIIFGGNDGLLHVFNASGNELPGFPLTFDGTLTGTPVVGDISGDGDADIIVGSSTAMLYAVDGDGNALNNFPFETSELGQIGGSAALGDFDNDGDMEIAFGLKLSSGPNIMVVDYKASASSEDLQWPIFGSDVWRSHNVSNVVVSVDDEIAIPVKFGLEQNYPNPFNAQTTIRFSLGTPGEAEIAIYDLLGRSINILSSGELTAGTHSIIWDGTNKSGQVVSSGIYFYRLTSSGETQTRRMVLLK